MLRRFAPLAVVLTAATALAAGQEPTYRSDAHTVSIYATVLDQDGRLVWGLGRDEFEIYDNGQRQELTVFANDIQPITIVVMIDRSGSMSPHFERVRDAAEQFVATLLPDDRARIGSFADKIQIDPRDFTSDKEQLVGILHNNLLPAGLTPLWDATAQAMNALANHDGRRVVLLFTDGKDTPRFGRSVTFDTVRSRSQVEEVMIYGIGFSQECGAGPGSPVSGPPTGRGTTFDMRSLALPAGPLAQPGSSGSTIQAQRRGQFPIPVPGGRAPGLPIPGLPIPGLPPGFPGPRPGGSTPEPPPTGRSSPPSPALRMCIADKPDPNLRELAAVGGGGYFELRSTDDLPSTFARVAEELHHQYLLAFVPTTLDNTLHRLEIRLKQPGLRPRARTGYLASKDK